MMDRLRFDLETMILKLFWILLLINEISTVPVNVALNKQISAELNCGMYATLNTEEFFGHSQVLLPPRNRKLETCTNSTYPATNMVDNTTSTWWQSASRSKLVERGFGINSTTAEIIVTLDLGQEYDVEKITISMGDSKRPGQLALYKSNVNNSFTPWVYRVSSDVECGTIFGSSLLNSPVASNSIICSAYSIAMSPNYEKLVFDFTNVPAANIAWRKTRYIQMKFFNMDLTLGATAVRFHHYTITDLKLLAECNCGGQHVGCNVSSTTGQYECICGGNTMGAYCQECKPFYNQKPYRQGVSCEACNCFSHADTCQYNSALDSTNKSLNAQGILSGGGQCIGCRDNTTGINCERCVNFYYRPIDIPQSQKNACIPCECNMPGSVGSLLSQKIGDCVTNSNDTLPVSLKHMKPGDCFCKSNVQGSKCNVCKPGFFNLMANNTNGCEACLCNSMGTVNGSNVCMADNTGQCPCKTFTTNRKCDACKQGYYGMSANNTQGCLSCGCDVGGSQNGVCNPVSGQCLCRQNVVGRQCTSPAANYYYPSLHFISKQAEHVAQLTNANTMIPGYKGFGYVNVETQKAYNMELFFPHNTGLSGAATLQFRYRASTAVAANLTFNPQVNVVNPVKLSLPVCTANWCTVDTSAIAMKPGQTYSINIIADNNFDLDQVVALPAEFLNTSALLGNESALFQSTCDVKNNDMKLSTNNEALCLKSAFTVSTFYLNRTLPCVCDVKGSYNQSCAVYGGQCPCKPGVGGRRCDVCLPQFYNLTSSGCSACSCSGVEKICNLNTGQCPCPPNVTGQKCDQCVTNFWNWNMTAGCQTCNCSGIGSSTLQCNLTTGVCPCKPGIGGSNCQSCLDGFAGYNSLGCAPCRCDIGGSLSTVCNKDNFQCSCKNNTQSLRCNTCVPGTFYIAPTHSKGCLECVCMGVSNVCTSTTQKLQTTILPLVNSTNNQSAVSLARPPPSFTATNTVPTYTVFNNTLPVLQLQYGIGSSEYWKVLSSGGDMLGIYQNNISFKIQWTSLDVSGTIIKQDIYIIGRNNIQLKLSLPLVPKDVVNDVSVQVTDTNVLTASGSPVTRQQLLLALTDVKAIYIPATWYNRAHTTRFFGVSYSMATPTGKGGPSLGVEQCICGKEYLGNSCQIGGIVMDMLNEANANEAAMIQYSPTVNINSKIPISPEDKEIIRQCRADIAVMHSPIYCSPSNIVSKIIPEQCIMDSPEEREMMRHRRMNIDSPIYSSPVSKKNPFGTPDSLTLRTQLNSTLLHDGSFYVNQQVISDSESISTICSDQNETGNEGCVITDSDSISDSPTLINNNTDHILVEVQSMDYLSKDSLDLQNGHSSPTFMTNSYPGNTMNMSNTILNNYPEVKMHLKSEVARYSNQLKQGEHFSVETMTVRDSTLTEDILEYTEENKNIEAQRKRHKNGTLKQKVKTVTRCIIKKITCGQRFESAPDLQHRSSKSRHNGTSKCAVGYKRANVTNHSYLGVCVQCQCNGHASQCDPDTGKCINCLHNTAGDNCEMCAAGFYGDATKGLSTDCTACPCLAPRVVNATCNITNGNPTCMYCAEGYTGALCDSCKTFYYGNPEVPNVGTCNQCNCSGNTGQCNSKTGQCLNCGSNSTGFNCEKCKDNWYGNASAQNCQACGCDMNGANSTICDHQTGQCSCFPGVGNRTCDSCQTNYYGYSNKSIFGCTSCKCNSAGSSSLQCDSQGACPCKPKSGGQKCEICALGYFGLPHKPCEVCNCNSTGTVNISLPCEREFGQCGCKAGVTGRQCDQCDRLYTGFSATGCTQCGVCQYSLGNDTLKMKERWTQYWNQSQEVLTVQNQDATLVNLTEEINQTSSLLGVSSNRLSELNNTVNKLNLEETTNNNTVNGFNDRVMTLLNNVQIQANVSVIENDRIKLLQLSALNESSKVTLLNTTSSARVTILENSVTESQKLVSNSLLQGSTKVNVSFTSQLDDAKLELNHTQNTASRAKSMIDQVKAQEKEILVLRNATELAQLEFNSLKKPLEEVINNTQVIHGVLDSVRNNINISETNNLRVHGLLNETDVITRRSIHMLETSQNSYTRGTKLFLDTKTIIDGMANGTLLPINTTMDLSKVPSFNQGADYLDKVEIPPLNASLNNHTLIELPRLKTYVQGLTTQSLQITNAYKTVESRGIQAVNAIKTYESVIASLSEAHTLAVAANQTMTQALTELQSVSVAALQQQAVNMISTASTLMTNVSSYDNTATTLQQQLNVANNSLTTAISVWVGLSSRITALNNASTGLTTIANDPALKNSITAGMRDVALTINSANILNGQAIPIQQAVTIQEGQLAVVQETVKNTTTTRQQINTDLFAFTPKLNEVKRTIDLTNNTYIASSSIKTRIEARIQLVEKKVQRARELLAKMEQPVSFKSGAHEQLSNPKAATPKMRYNEIKFDFKYDLEPQGILFFTENNATKEKLLVQMINKTLVFEFSNVDKTMTAVSPIALTRGNWHNVQATRYGIDGQLTVTKLSTGGTAVTHFKGDSTSHNQLTLNSDIFVAGLPSGYPVTKVSPGTNFEGCIYQLTFDGFTIPLWQNILHQNSKAQCCTPPVELPGPVTSNATTFTGFGSYAKVNLSSLPIQNSHLALQFRTFSPDGLILLADTPGVAAYYGLMLQGGRVGLQATAASQALNLRTDKMYNDGKWYQLTAQFNQSYALLHVQNQVNNTWVTSEVKSQAHAVNLVTLTAPQFTLGGQNPNTTSNFGPTTRMFAGCIQAVQHNIGPDLTLQPVTLQVTASVGVSNNMCYQEVVSGVGISSAMGYLALNDIPSPLTYLEFDLLTYQQDGILFFAELNPSPPTTFLYVALYHGDIIVMFNQGSGIRPPLRTRGLDLANGLSYTVTLDFRFQNSPRLTVLSQRHYGALSMTTGMVLRNGIIYAGGAPSSITLDASVIPVRHSIIGGVRNVKVNTASANYIINHVPSLQKDAFLSGLPSPPASPPPLPYTTTPAPPTQPTPTCAPKSQFSMSSVGVRFGDQTVSYMAFTIKNAPLFMNRFVLRVEFRAVQPNGILIYMSSTTSSAPYYMCLYMQGGYLKFSMQTNSTASKTTPLTKNITSKFTYNDGKWWKLDVLRINDFLAITFPGTSDYVNNGQIGSTTDLNLNTPLYIGGVSAQHVGTPFSNANEVGVGTSSFHGCIKSVTISHSNTDFVSLNFSAPLSSVGVSKCYAQVNPGAYLNSSTAYVLVEDDATKTFNIAQNFEIHIGFRSSGVNGTLAVAYKSQTRFFLIDIVDGQISFLIGNAQLQTAPLIGRSSTLDIGYGLCSGQLHNLTVKVETTRLQFNFDGKGWETITYPDNFSPPNINAVPLYAGGLKNQAWVFPTTIGRQSFNGCLQTFTVNSKSYNLVASSDKNAVVAGCPV